MQKKKTINLRELLIVVIFVILFIAIHSIYYRNLFVFIYDQVTSSTTVLELWKTKSISLIGPPMSLTIENRQIFFGGISYYIQMFFMLIGRFDPFWSTYAFMCFSAIMIVPLYYGVKNLVNKYAAILLVMLYTFLPFFIESTNSLWNPYFMFSLFPLFIFLMGSFKSKKRIHIFAILSILGGIFFQLHYMYIFVWIALGIYYLLFMKLPWYYGIIYVFGFILGNLNMVIFELRHNFYTLQTLLIFATHPKKVSEHWFADYYLLSEIFFLTLFLLSIIKNKLNRWIIYAVFTIGIFVSIPYVTIQTINRNYPKDWYYKDDVKVYEIIKSNLTTIRNFNIFEFYVATGTLPKYFLKKDNIQMNYDDYYLNKYLYVVYKNDQFMKDSAYEVATFYPSKIIKTWKINPVYRLYLLERLN